MILLTFFPKEFTGITADSRQVTEGALFLAYPGVHSDGRQYISQAIAAGAAGVMWESADYTWNTDWDVRNLGVQGLKEQVGEIAAEYYAHPSQTLSLLGVTGTNGKTSVTQWLAQALSHLGEKTAVIGTIGNGFVDEQTPSANTTPDAVLLQAMLADYAAQGAKAVAMEVSSHGLHQGRVNGARFKVAVLTNLSRDHLDYHETMEAYAAAKAKLFFWPDLTMAVLNADESFGQQLAQKMTEKHRSFITYGLHAGDVRGSNLRLQQHGLSMHVNTPQGAAAVFAPVLGRFNAYNVLAVLATLLTLGCSLHKAVNAIAHIKAVPGRMQQFGGDGQPLVVVDYAHTPDALEKVLLTLREQLESQDQLNNRAKLICVFGCGGDRDAGKRPLMGQVAEHLAEVVVLTSDNPREEAPLEIIAQISAGMTKPHYKELDRRLAIAHAIALAQADDIVLLAGKGHEDYQEIKGVRMPLSDADIALEVLGKWEVHA
jgi:UDP-N-acetylmuramyl-tripeptide synthetase